MKSVNENVLTPPSQSTFTTLEAITKSFYGTQEERLALIDALIEAGGPRENDYKTIDAFFETLYNGVQNGIISAEEINQIKALFSSDMLDNTIHGYVLRKPMGYAGDFKIIDMIYTHFVNDHPAYNNWDHYFHYHAATQAVNNRKEFFKKNMLAKIANSSEPLRLLNVASGPARDLAELYQQIEKQKLTTTCVELDPRAIEFAKGLCENHLDQVEFIHKNILRFSTDNTYDVIWSAGLFDYFDDKIFVMVLKRLLTFLKPGGEIILGNFSDRNASRGYMEILGEWFLIHRSTEKLIQLAVEAGGEVKNVRVDKEPLGINLFLRISKN